MTDAQKYLINRTRSCRVMRCGCPVTTELLTSVDHSGDLRPDHAQSEPLLKQYGFLSCVSKVHLHLSLLRAPRIQKGSVEASISCDHRNFKLG